MRLAEIGHGTLLFAVKVLKNLSPKQYIMGVL